MKGIDFNLSSKLWRLNKNNLENGMFEYKKNICNAYTKKNLLCKMKVKGNKKYCHLHSKNENNH